MVAEVLRLRQQLPASLMDTLFIGEWGLILAGYLLVDSDIVCGAAHMHWCPTSAAGMQFIAERPARAT
jgi:hypothetical protein